MSLYHIISLGKFVLGVGVLLITYTTINVYEDPLVGIGLVFLGIFIAAWGGSFYLFLGIQKMYRTIDNLLLYKDSYKLSLLFGIFVVLNFLLVLLGWWNKGIGLVLLLLFAFIQWQLFSDTTPKSSHE